jgi:RNAse (barnase) inhibitor barstar
MQASGALHSDRQITHEAVCLATDDGRIPEFCVSRDLRRNATMLLQTVRPNIVQSIRAYRVEDLMQAAQAVDQHFLYANLSAAQSKQEVLEAIAEAFMFPAHFGKNLDALYDCMTDLVHKAGSQPGFVVVLEQLPDNPRFDREAREQLLDVFRDAADFWAERKVPFRCFYSFQ